MPRKLDEFPKRVTNARSGSQFDELFDGNIWEVGLEDYPNYRDIETLRGGILGLAYKRRFKMKTTVHEGKLIVQRITEDEDE